MKQELGLVDVRGHVIEWIYQVQRAYEFQEATAMHALKIYDKFMIINQKQV